MKLASSSLASFSTKLIVGGTLAAFVGSSCFYTVYPGERAIIFHKFRGGIGDEVYKEGLHFRLPGIEEVIKYDIRLKPAEFQTFTNTKDLQKVHLHLRILHRPIEENIPKIHKEFESNYAKKFLETIGKEVLKAAIAQYDASQLLKKREKISSEIKENLINRSRDFYMHLDDVSLNDMKFTGEFMKSIERKQIAQQEAVRQEYLVRLGEETKKAQIVINEGKSEAARLVSHASNKYGNTMIQLRKMEAALHIAENLAQSGNVSFVPKGGNFLFSI